METTINGKPLEEVIREHERLQRDLTVALCKIMPYDYTDAAERGVFNGCETIGDKASALLRWKLAWLESL